MPIDFPDNPVNGDTFTSSGRTWEFDGVSWIAKLATPSVASGSITVDKLADDAVHTAKIAAGAVTSAKIAAGSITATEIGTGAVTAGKIDSLAVTTGKLAADSVTEAKIAASAVSEAKIATSAVSETKIATDAVTEVKIANNAVTTNKIADNAVTTGKIAAGAVGNTDLADNAVSQAKLANTLSGITICTSSTRPASPFSGQAIYETDTTRILVWVTSSWVGIAKADNVTVNSSGIMSGTQQPRFFATRSGDTSYVGGSDIVFNTAVYNVGSHYSTTTGLFTAPVAGTYIFDVGVYQSAAVRQLWFRINGNRERSFATDNSSSTNFAGQGIVFLNAGDTLGIASWSDGATVTMYSNFHHNYLRGCLIS